MDEEKPENRLVISSKKSLYDPIEIVIDDQIYYSLKTTRPILKEIDKLDDEIARNKQNREALYKVVQLMYNIDIKILEKLDAREVEDIYVFSKKKFAEIEMTRLKLAKLSFGANLGTERVQVQKVIRKNQKRSGGNK